MGRIDGFYKKYLKKSKKIIGVVLIIFCCICILYGSNMRLTSLSALKANPSIGKIEKVIAEINLDWGKVYIVNTPEAFKTASVEKYGPFWRSSVSFYSNKVQMKNDKIKTIGYMSYSKNEQQQIQILGIWNEDSEVKSIHITREDGEIYTQPAPLNKLILFQWDDVSNVNSMSILGLNEKGKPLYQYGYPEGTTIFRDSEFKWHPII